MITKLGNPSCTEKGYWQAGTVDTTLYQVDNIGWNHRFHALGSIGNV